MHFLKFRYWFLAALVAVSCGLACRPRFASHLNESAAGRHVIGPPVPYQPTTMSFDESHNSIFKRRQLMWQIFRQITRSVATPQGGSVPVFQTWYDTNEFQRLANQMFLPLSEEQRQLENPFTREQVFEFMNAMANNREVGRWTDADLQVRFDKKESANFGTIGPAGSAPNGSMIYSPDFVSHMITNKTWNKPEFPTSAVMLKVSWTEDGRSVMDCDSNAGTLGNILSVAHADWKCQKKSGLITDKNTFSFRTSKNKTFLLNGMHLSTRDYPNWLWATFWFSKDPRSDFGEDMPEDLKNDPIWSNFKMCVVDDYKELPTAFDIPENFASLKAAYEAIKQHGKGYSWCSNPNMEEGFANTNCIGCHNGSGNEFHKGEKGKNNKHFLQADDRIDIDDSRNYHETPCCACKMDIVNANSQMSFRSGDLTLPRGAKSDCSDVKLDIQAKAYPANFRLVSDRCVAITSTKSTCEAANRGGIGPAPAFNEEPVPECVGVRKPASETKMCRYNAANTRTDDIIDTCVSCCEKSYLTADLKKYYKDWQVAQEKDDEPFMKKRPIPGIYSKYSECVDSCKDCLLWKQGPRSQAAFDRVMSIWDFSSSNVY